MSTSHPDSKADDRRHVEFGPGVIGLLLESKQVEEDWLFECKQAQWAELLCQLRGVEGRRRCYQQLGTSRCKLAERHP